MPVVQCSGPINDAFRCQQVTSKPKKHVGSCTHTGLHVHPRRFARSPEHNPGSLFHAPKSRFCRGQSLFVCLFAFHTADLSFHNTPWVSKIPAFSVLPPRVKVVLAGLLTKFSRCRGSNVSPLGPREARMDTCMSDTPRNHGCAEEYWCSHRAFRLQLGLGRPGILANYFSSVQHVCMWSGRRRCVLQRVERMRDVPNKCTQSLD